MTTRRVWVTHRFVGFHRWQAAPDERAYLRDLHRHVFHVRVEVDVDHDDRHIEFHDLLDVVAAECDALSRHPLGLGSCEMIAGRLARRVTATWTGRRVACDVSEDGENGATVLHER